MFKIESYVTPILLSYVDKYVRDFKPANAQVSLWGGGVALQNLVLKEDVLQREVRLPFTLVSGRIHELLIQVPWTKIMSEPIVVTIDTIECVLNLKPPSPDEKVPQESPSRKTQVVEAPPGYMQALVRRIVSNIAVKVHHLIVKYVQDDIVMSLNVKHLSIDSAGTQWEKSFADIDQNMPVIRRLVQFDDFTLCLDKADADGKIRFYQEPLLYRCQLDLRVLTRLISASTRRASTISIQLRSSKLAWSVTSEQLTLLLRLINERPPDETLKPPPSVSKPALPTPSPTSNTAEPQRTSSWSEWAWSWLPSWTDKEGEVDDVPITPMPVPLYFSAFLDDISLVFKILEIEFGTNRKRFRSILEVGATYAALKSGICFPTGIRARFGARAIEVRSFGKCVCGFVNTETLNDQATVYVKRIEEIQEPWEWPEDQSFGRDNTQPAKEVKSPPATEPSPIVKPAAEAAPETTNDNQNSTNVNEPGPSANVEPSPTVNATSVTRMEGIPEGLPSKELPRFLETGELYEMDDEPDPLWVDMNPVIFVEFSHDRAPQNRLQNPYDNPPKDFEYSDWAEEVHIKLSIQPIEMRTCMGLVHRLLALYNIFKEVYSAPKPKPQKRVLTVEECDSLNDNTPERRFSFNIEGLKICLIPWNHTVTVGPVVSPLALFFEIPKTTGTVNAPLYPHRVCAAACQLPGTMGTLWQSSRLHFSIMINQANCSISTLDKLNQKTCARADIRLVTHILLNKAYFTKAESVELSYLLKISNANICGSAARLQAAYQVPLSLMKERISIPLEYSSLPRDALHDEASVAIDFELEEVILRGFHTKNVNTNICTIQSAKATAFYEPKPGEMRQAWLFSAPDTPITTPYLRLAIQWCNEVTSTSFDYLGLWTEPTAISIDPLLISWLAYKPILTSRPSETTTASSLGIKSFGSTQYLQRIRGLPSTASKSAQWTTSEAERVHVRQRSSVASSTEPSDKKSANELKQTSCEWWYGEKLVCLHNRLRYLLMNVEIGLTLMYVTMNTVSAVDCATLRDAMERHAIEGHIVLALSLGRISVRTNAANKHLWTELRHDGPTFLQNRPDAESFPWKICLADVSCYTMEIHEDRDKVDAGNFSPSALRSTMKSRQAFARQHTVLDLVTTTITVSVVTKAVLLKIPPGSPPTPFTHKKPEEKVTNSTNTVKARYFTSGKEFKPSTLKEFFRGPRRVKKEPGTTKTEPTKPATPEKVPDNTIPGPLLSLGVNLHADTPPIVVRLEHDQVHVIFAAIHGMNHIVTLLKRDSVTIPKRNTYASSKPVQSVEEESLSDDSKSTDIIDILAPSKAEQKPVKTFLWFQWVVSHAKLIVASDVVKLALDIDDVISTIDLQSLYHQFKIKIAAASIRYYERTGVNDWLPGPLGGRVLEVKEAGATRVEDNFLSMTVTNAKFSNLPQSWKQELHPKLLELKEGEDTMWEVYAILAPLEIVIQPVILESVGLLLAEMRPRASCPLKVELESRPPQFHWPFCYLTSGGLRLLITGENETGDADDTFMFHIGSVTINPHPENPVCRRLTNSPGDAWPSAASNSEGRQYEINVKNFGIRTAQFNELVSQESSTTDSHTNLNPAYKWSQQTLSLPSLATILHPVDVCCVVAPAVYTDFVMTIGPALDFNLISDCVIDLNISQIAMWQLVMNEIKNGLSRRQRIFLTRKVDKYGICPYADFVILAEPDVHSSTFTFSDAFLESVACDSGVETLASMPTTTSKSRNSEDIQIKKVVSYAQIDNNPPSEQFIECFFTMGTVEFALYVDDEDDPVMSVLRPPASVYFKQAMTLPNVNKNQPQSTKTDAKAHPQLQKAAVESNRSITADLREADVGHSKLNIWDKPLKTCAQKLPLLHVTLMQPNLYYWKNRGQNIIQMSLFDAGIELGMARSLGVWHLDLMVTGRGASDPLTGIPPALATMKIVAPVSGPLSGANQKGSIKLDVERPVEITMSEERVIRIMAICKLLNENLNATGPTSEPVRNRGPMLYNLRQNFLHQGIETVVVNTSQVGLCGLDGAFGWDSTYFQMTVGGRTERVSARVLFTAVVFSIGPPKDIRHVMLHPMMMGAQMEATWEAWRRAEGGPMAHDPSVMIGLELDHFTVDIRPSYLATFTKLYRIAVNIKEQREFMTPKVFGNNVSRVIQRPSIIKGHNVIADLNPKQSNTRYEEINSHYYKDDLRSGAFKILQGGQLPMAYQVILHGHAVSWRYPHPRSITRIVAFPLPGANTETNCVLEVYTPLLEKWEPHTYFKIPVGDPREFTLNVSAPDTVFATMWRFRACRMPDTALYDYTFDIEKFKTKGDPLLVDKSVDEMFCSGPADISAEQLSGVLRVDSYFAPRHLPRVHFIVQMGGSGLYLYNSLPLHSSNQTLLEGYYVSRPLMRSHRTLGVFTRNTKMHFLLGTSPCVMAVVNTTVSADIIDCETGTMEQLIKQFRVQAGVSSGPSQTDNMRVRVATSIIQVALHVARLRTVQALYVDWCASYETCYPTVRRPSINLPRLNSLDTAMHTASMLEGRVSLWVHNSSASALRIGQEGTDEVVPLGPGARLAYRWHSPTAPKRLHLAVAGPTANWQWSPSVPFTVNSMRVKLVDPSTEEKQKNDRDVNTCVFVEVVESGAKRTMTLSGRLVLANMLRFNFLYKVKARCPTTGQWRTVCSDEMQAESVGRSVVCSTDTDLVLKMKRMPDSKDTGWSGDIPLKECPKENVPWLVKVPLSGDMSYVSVWCRVVRARSNSRILATMWPLYVLHSHLPLDTDVLIVTEKNTESFETTTAQNPTENPPLIQSTPGRGCSTHLLTPGTTANRHNLSFQYRNIESPVTREAVPMHYGVTDVSVFDKRTSVINIEEVIENINEWLKRSGRDSQSDWPYSIVAKHWIGNWMPALMQPRCDVSVRYRAVHAGGGCSLEIQLCPIVLLCNAVPIPFTLRAHDAAPLCKLESGSATSPPSVILTKPFYLSMDMGRDTYVSEQLVISSEEPGRYGSLPPRHVALDRAARFAIVCNDKVALLTLYYEIKEEINVLGITSTYVFINRLDQDLLVSPNVIPSENTEHDLVPKSFKLVHPVPEGSIHGISLSRFTLRGRWRGSDPSGLRKFLSLATVGAPARMSVPVRLGKLPLRRAVALCDGETSIPVVVTQMKHENRWLVVVSHDPCPQFIVNNRTQISFYIAQSESLTKTNDQNFGNNTITECQGIQWWSSVYPNSMIHYSSPAYCLRYPPTTPPSASQEMTPEVTMLTFGKKIETKIEEWCAPIAVTDGEQLIQFYGDVTIKLRVCTYPHSTLLELRETDQNDISASDIRRRLDGSFSLESFRPIHEPTDNLEKSDAVSQVIQCSKSIPKPSQIKRVEETISYPSSSLRSDDTETPNLDEPETTTTPTIDQSSTSNLRDAHASPSGTNLTMSSRDNYYQKSDSQMLFETTSMKNVDLNYQQSSFIRQTPESNVKIAFDPFMTQWEGAEHLRFMMTGLAVEMAASADVPPLFALHLDRTVLLVTADSAKTKTTLSVTDIQIDNLQYESGQYDFAVVASTRAVPLEADQWPALWTMFGKNKTFEIRNMEAKVLLQITHDKWNILQYYFNELTELELQIGSLALYVEDAYVTSLVDLSRIAWAATVSSEISAVLAEERAIQSPLRLRRMYVHPLDLTLTLHTAVRMYIALDQSPLRLSAFKLHHVFTSPDRLTHALTVHYLSAAILGAGWVVGGLELLGAPGALVTRLGGASGGVKGMASATAAALLRSLSAWAGSLARNLDILAGDEDHARRAAAARRRLPPSFIAGLFAGVTNFAINILGAVGGLAHHPLVGVAVGETDSSVAALRRGVIGALTKPLSATADLVAYAGHGLLRQTGWDPVPMPRSKWQALPQHDSGGWRRDCVRWLFRLAQLNVLAGFEVLFDNLALQLLVTEKYLVVADPENERIIEMIDFRFCTVGPNVGPIIELRVTHRRQMKSMSIDEEDEQQISANAMARVARYTGTEGTTSTSETRVLSLMPPPGTANSLHAMLTAVVHQNDDTYLTLL